MRSLWSPWPWDSQGDLEMAGPRQGLPACWNGRAERGKAPGERPHVRSLWSPWPGTAGGTSM